MPKAFYTDIRQWGDNLLYSGYDNTGKKIRREVKFKPSLYIHNRSGDDKNTDAYSIFGEPLSRIRFDTIKTLKRYVEDYSHISNYHIYGNTECNQQLIAELYQGNEIEFEYERLKIFAFDIEVYSPEEFPKPEKAEHPIVSISMEDKTSKIMHVFYWDASPTKFKEEFEHIELDIEVKFWKGDNEIDMLNKFISVLSGDKVDEYPDILTGWNSNTFDIPYLVNRLKKILPDKVSKLSPWGRVREVKINQGVFDDTTGYDLYGIACIDYMDIYKKYTMRNMSSFSLQHVTETELGVGKLDYEGSINKLFEEDFQKYVEYNIIDVKRISELEDTLLYLELLVTVSYAGGIDRYANSLGTVRYWEALIYNYLYAKKIIPSVKGPKAPNSGQFSGAYVKDPQKGMHEWIVSFDYTSLYPSILMQANIGVESLIKHDIPDDLLELRSKITEKGLINKELDLSLLKKYDVSMTSNGAFFKKDSESFLSELMKKFFTERKRYQGMMKKVDKEIEALQDKQSLEVKQKRLLSKQLNTKQQAFKILINSAYGACGNENFNYYEVENAEGITSTGRTAIQWSQRHINDWINDKLKNKKYKDYIAAIDTDSVGGESLLHINNEDITIENLFKRYETSNLYLRYDDFNEDYVIDLSDQNLTTSSVTKCGTLENKSKVNYIMKHRVKKRMFEIEVDNKKVRVTEDHSIIIKRKGNYISVKPRDIKDSDILITINTIDTDSKGNQNVIIDRKTYTKGRSKDREKT